MGEPTFLYHPDCLEGQIFDSSEVDEKLGEGWFDNPTDAKETVGGGSNYSSMTVKDLKALCEERDIQLTVGTKKADIIYALEENDGGEE